MSHDRVKSNRRGDGHLAPGSRALLEALILDRPGLSGAQIAAIFLARTGERVHRFSVNQTRRRLRAEPGPGNGQLPPVLSELLDLLCHEAAEDGPASAAEVARMFEAATGRRISRPSANARLRALGLEVARSASRWREAERMRRARERHAAALPVDRSARVVKRGRAPA